MKNETAPKSKKFLGWIFWGIIISATLIWLMSQQGKINKYEAEKAELEKSQEALEERNEELSTIGSQLTEEEYEREARKQGFVRPDEVILKEAE